MVQGSYVKSGLAIRNPRGERCEAEKKKRGEPRQERRFRKKKYTGGYNLGVGGAKRASRRSEGGGGVKKIGGEKSLRRELEEREKNLVYLVFRTSAGERKS